MKQTSPMAFWALLASLFVWSLYAGCPATPLPFEQGNTESSADAAHQEVGQEPTAPSEVVAVDDTADTSNGGPERSLERAPIADTGLSDDKRQDTAKTELTNTELPQEQPPVSSFRIEATPQQGQVCQAFLYTLKAMGGTDTGYRWRVLSGQLPDNVKLTPAGTPWAYLHGTPTQKGAFAVTIEVSDAKGNQATTSLTIQVAHTTRLLYVDSQIASATCTTYDLTTRRCGTGTQPAYKTIKGAADVAIAGDTVLLRAGTYNEQLVPKQSGKAGQCITYRNYQKEVVTLTGAAYPAIDISNRSYLLIEGLKVANIRRWLYALKASHNVIRNNHFLNATDSGGSSKTGLFFQEATHNRVIGNTIEQTTQDNLSLIKSDRNVIEGNTFRNGKHVLWVIKCGNFNIIRNNDLDNQLQKIGEIYDCDGVGFNGEFDLVDATRSNVVEGNTFAYTPSSGDSSPYAGIQYAGQRGIIRHNRFYRTIGPGLSLTLYGKEAQFNTANRIYHNVFANTQFAGVSLAGGSTFQDNVFKNNILAHSLFQRNDKRWQWYQELEGKPVQLMTGRTDGFVFLSNNFYHKGAGEAYLITHGRRDSSTNPTQQPLSWWEQNHPTLFANNLEKDPGFVDVANNDFRLKPGSAMIDQGAHLTKTVGAGRGVTLLVQDVGYFQDGYQIPGEIGDIIQIEGQPQTARILSIDATRKSLTLDRALTWGDGAGVSLAFYGAKPDLGAHEAQ